MPFLEVISLKRLDRVEVVNRMTDIPSIINHQVFPQGMKQFYKGFFELQNNMQFYKNVIDTLQIIIQLLSLVISFSCLSDTMCSVKSKLDFERELNI